MISIIMPTYNCAEFISDAIKSILIQSYTDFEFLIIDDGSEDDTENVVKKNSDNRIKFLKKPHTGLMDTLDFGIRIAKNELIARMDADDIAHPDRLARQIVFLKMHPRIDILSNWYAVFKNRIEYLVKRSINHEEIVKNLSLYSDICHPSVMFKKSSILRCGGFKTEFEFDPFGDYKVWLKNKSKLIFHNIPEILHFYRDRNNSLSSEALRQKRVLVYKIQEPYYQNNLMAEFGISEEESIIARGWREYLYGDINKAKKFWKELGLNRFLEPVIFAASLIKYLPKSFHKKLYGKRILNKLGYSLSYFNSVSIKARKDFNDIKKRLTVAPN